jgi:hypothetical protein
MVWTGRHVLCLVPCLVRQQNAFTAAAPVDAVCCLLLYLAAPAGHAHSCCAVVHALFLACVAPPSAGKVERWRPDDRQELVVVSTTMTHRLVYVAVRTVFRESL